MSKPDEAFFVGYHPMPPALKRLGRRMITVLLPVMATLALTLAILREEPGPAVWERGRPTALTGTLRVEPYPHLVAAAPDAAPVVLLVGEGKRGIAERIRPLEGQHVELRGHRLHRGTLQMVEVLEATPLPIPAAVVPALPLERDGLLTLSGEIVDSKCFLGAMKPGNGKTHRACATLCIRGGIPPLLVTGDERGGLRGYLLTDADGQPLAGESLEALVPFIAEPVEVTGRLQQINGLWIVRIERGGIRRSL